MQSVMITFVVLLITSLHLASANPLTQLFGAVNRETPPYDILNKGKNYEVRRYQSQLWAQIDYSVDPSTDFNDKTSIGFQPLFEYITGKNIQREQLPMTAPVIMEQLDSNAGHRRMAFIMAASVFSRLDQLPKPTHSNITLVAVNQPRIFACIKFNMSLTSKRVATREAELRQAANNDGIKLDKEQKSVRVGGYNPPWTLPWFRTNEICIPLLNQA